MSYYKLYSVVCYTHICCGDVAQWLEQSAHNRLAVGSNPTIPTNKLIAYCYQFMFILEHEEI